MAKTATAKSAPKASKSKLPDFVQRLKDGNPQHNDKTRAAIWVMEQNVSKPYEEVSKMIAETLGVSLTRAKVYYRHKIINRIAEGYDYSIRPWEKGQRAKAEKKAAAVVKASKAPAKATKPAPAAKDVEAIKAKNAARLKAVAAKVKAPTAEDKARQAELEQVNKEAESHEPPAFLKKD